MKSNAYVILLATLAVSMAACQSGSDGSDSDSESEDPSQVVGDDGDTATGPDPTDADDSDPGGETHSDSESDPQLDTAEGVDSDAPIDSDAPNETSDVPDTDLAPEFAIVFACYAGPGEGCCIYMDRLLPWEYWGDWNSDEDLECTEDVVSAHMADGSCLLLPGSCGDVADPEILDFDGGETCPPPCDP